ncbi:MAG: hypothetical protein Q3971_04245 [Moraxella sp.]|nr:hypothetical protein [Moraxella sp.]
MKAKLSLAIIATTALLTACSGSHEKVHAVDKVEEAQKQALEKAPKAEEVKFDDHGAETVGGVGGTKGIVVAPTATDTAQTPSNEATATATTEAQAPADANKEAEVATDTATTEEPTKTEETPVQ